MNAEQLGKLLALVPDESGVYFKIPEEMGPGDEVAIETIKYNAITNETVLGWDCKANYDL